MNRRRFLKLAGAGAGAVGGLYVGSKLLGRIHEGGPPDVLGWTLTFEDAFDDGSLDTQHWGVGWGWGRETSSSPTRITPDNVGVRDGALRLSGSHDEEGVQAGAINTKDAVTFGPGSYLEARIKFAGREGFLNAFWAKPNSEAWPPEIDVVELWQDGSGWDDTHLSRHHLHYSTSTIPGDASTHRNVGVSAQPGGDLTERFHVYGVEWQPDSIVHYVDGEPIEEWTDETILRAMQRGAPFYLMLSVNVDAIGDADRSEPWSEEMLVDWVRVWERDPLRF